MSSNTIVCATDLGPSGRSAADLATALARAAGAQLALVHVADLGGGARYSAVPDSMRPAADAMRERLRARALGRAAALEAERSRCEAMLAGAQSAKGGTPLRCEAFLEEGRPWETIVESAARHDALILVVGPGRHAGARSTLGERLLGSTADRVVRHAPCPVLVASHDAAAVEALEGALWLVAVDMSQPSIDALREARLLATRTRGRVAIVHAVGPFEDEEEQPPEALIDHLRSDAGARLDEAARAAASEPAVVEERRIVWGRPAVEIARAADELGAAILVLGSHGRTGVSRLVLGSTAEACLRRARVPVLVVRRGQPGRA